MNIDLEWRNFDVLVIGSGGAGTNAAETAAKAGASVLLVAKDPLSASDTKISSPVSTNCSGCEFYTKDGQEQSGLLSGKKECLNHYQFSIISVEF